MIEELLVTKTRLPPVRSEHVHRPELVERLERGRSRRLTLIAAPAGYGKTSLAAEWLARSREQTAWLSLDAADDDPVQLMAYLAEALRARAPGFRALVVNAIRSGEPPSPGAFVRLLIDHACAWGEQVVLALDDYHVLADPIAHRLIAELVERAPETLHLVLTCRADPPLPIARLRARGSLSEIRARDLRFGAEETRAFLRKVGRVALSDRSAEALEAGTEGWVAGLQLAAISLRAAEDPDARAAGFSGAQRDVVDYLTEDVIRRQAAEVQRFLLDTSVLDRLSAGLCDAVTGRRDGQAMLERLERENLFIVSLDESRRWYRYHQMFAEALRLRLRRAEPTRVAENLERAARWSAENGALEASVEFALQAGSHRLAAPLIEQLALTSLFAQARWSTVLRWTAPLPEPLLDARPSLAIARAWALFATGAWPEAATILDRLDRSIAEAPLGTEGAIRAQLETLRSCIHYELGDLEACLADCAAALEQLPEDEGFARSVAELNAGLAQLWLGDAARARETLDRAIGLALESGGTTIALLAIGGAMEVALEQGRPGDVEALYARAREIGRGPGGIPYEATGMAGVVMGERLRELGSLEEAERVLREGITLCRSQGGMPEVVLQGQVTLARVLLAAGRESEARELAVALSAELSAHRARPGDADAVLRRVLRERLRLRIELGDLTGVAGAEAAPADALIEPLSARELEILAQVAAGGSNPEIARRVHLSPHTVKVYVSRIYDKLGARGRAQAVARAYELGLLEP